MKLDNIIAFVSWSIIVLIFVIILVINLITPNSSEIIEKERIERAIFSEVERKYPDADIIEILNITDVGDTKEVTVRVSFNLSSTCPKRIHLYFYYPKQHFLPKLPEYIVKDCSFCKNGKCIIWFEEEAIQASINMPGTERIREFVEKYNAKPSARKTANTWLVIWSSDEKMCSIVLHERGEILNIEC